MNETDHSTDHQVDGQVNPLINVTLNVDDLNIQVSVSYGHLEDLRTKEGQVRSRICAWVVYSVMTWRPFDMTGIQVFRVIVLSSCLVSVQSQKEKHDNSLLSWFVDLDINYIFVVGLLIVESKIKDLRKMIKFLRSL